MKSNFLALAVLAAAFSAPAFATEHEGWVYNGLTGMGSASADLGSGRELSDDTFSSNPNIGYRWGTFGLEAGFALFGKYERNFSGVGDSKLKVNGWNVGANVNSDISDKWSVQGRVGVFGWNADLDFDFVNPAIADLSASDSGNDYYAGASIDYKWSKRSSFGLGYTYFKAGDADVSLWGLHSEFRF